MSAMKGEAGAVSRRACLMSLSAGPAAWLAAPQAAHAGGQLEEPLIDSVRTALSSAVLNQAPPEPQFGTTEARLLYLRWLGTMSDRLRRRKPDWEVRRDFLQTVWYESKRAGLDVSLVLGLVQVESAFRKFAVSSVGARGYMQVMPFWTRVIGDGDPGKLFHMQTNLRFGCVILRHYLDRERGDLFMTLGRYNGSRGRPQYPDAVFAAQRNWVFQDRITTAAEGLAPAGG
ncbi:lytic transglycosylase domain-containing protein [Acidovorax sp. SUPP1855]|uniref:lytic transglycosylase domain-containing protein n=1 Tax=Acidovorax sp. SUPP1855 TaxID=431774 RepID=UPI0023DE3289|nr:lytic transglycosylase domain-containing protein [Acidovorax sp. SUPP1855]GKS83336.1 lytic transglycosylase domain-containing protein [Acidovorax sp. SUPP1855]